MDRTHNSNALHIIKATAEVFPLVPLHLHEHLQSGLGRQSPQQWSTPGGSSVAVSTAGHQLWKPACPWSPAPSRWAGQHLPPKAAAVGTTCGQQHSESEGHILDLSSRPRPRVGRVIMIMGRGGSVGKLRNKEQQDMKGWSQPGSGMFHSSPL